MSGWRWGSEGWEGTQTRGLICVGKKKTIKLYFSTRPGVRASAVALIARLAPTGLMLQLQFVLGDLVCERSDVCGKSAGWRSVAFHSGGLYVLGFFITFFLCRRLRLLVSHAMQQIHLPDGTLRKKTKQEQHRPGSMKSDMMWLRDNLLSWQLLSKLDTGFYRVFIRPARATGSSKLNLLGRLTCKCG